MSEFIKNVDARTMLAGTNKLEILLFRLGTDQRTGRCESFGINVFKVREVMRAPEITHAPDMPASVEGMVSLRGELIPVLNLAKYLGIPCNAQQQIMISTEYNGHVQGFLVEAVDSILRVDWSAMKTPPDMMAAEMGGLVTAVTELAGGRLAMILDVEKVLSETSRVDHESMYKDIEPIARSGKTVLYADDSSVARKQIERTLRTMGVRAIAAVNGRDAWERLERLAQQADASGANLKDLVTVVLTDVEMPEMDGYMLTRKIKSDRRFSTIPVIMHSSLSGISNHQLGKSVGADEYVPKFEPRRLAETLARLMA